MEIVSEFVRAERLKSNQTCRFCLAPDVRLSSIYAGPEHNKATPLTLQIMACAGIEVYKDDGMPGVICETCRALFNCCYQFKQMCNNADVQLRTFLVTGVWPKKPSISKDLAALLPHLGSSRTVVSSPSAPRRYVTDKKSNIIKLCPVDLKNIKQGQPLSMLSRGAPAKAAPMNMTPSNNMSNVLPVMTSTPIVKRMVSEKEHNEAPGMYQHDQQQPVPPKVKTSPVILNKLVNTGAPKVQEQFITKADGTLEMVMSDEPLTNDDKGSGSPLAQTDKVFPCGECERTFPLKQLLDLHQLNHKRERKHACDQCDKRFFSKYDLAKHYGTHTGERPFVCVVCNASFLRSTMLTRHQATHKDEPKYLCTLCARSFLSNDELMKHMKHHEKPRPYQCDKCPKQFAYKQGLDRHEVIHMEKLPFQCAYCEKSYMTSGKLSRHLTTHAGDRPYPCRLCTKSFLLSHHLTRHLRSHNSTGQADYKCCDCDVMCKTIGDLISHSTVHAMKNFKCPLCREQFNDLKTVTEHIKTHSAKAQFPCDYCDLMYTSEAKLEEHCLQQHRNELAYERTEGQQIGESGDTEADDGDEDDDDTPDPLMECDIHESFRDGFLVEDDDTTLIANHLQVGETYEITEIAEASDSVGDPFVEPPSTMPFETVLVKAEMQPVSPSQEEVRVSRQKRMEEFFKRNQAAVEKKEAHRNVSDVLKNLPKGVTIKRPTVVPTEPIQKPKVEVTSPNKEEEKPKVRPFVAQRATVVPKRGPGRPPKVDKSSPSGVANVPATKVARKEEPKQPPARQSTIPVRSEKPTGGDRPLQRSASAMVISRGRSTMGGRENAASTAMVPAKSTQSLEPSWMIKRTYAPKATSVVGGKKRSAEQDLADSEQAAPSKRMALGRKTLNPSMLRPPSDNNAMGKPANVPASTGTEKINIATAKRKPAEPSRTPMELNVGGKTIKVHKISKEEATTAMKRNSQIKGKM